MQGKGFYERRVVSGRPLDARKGLIDAIREGEAGEKLFRWTLAGRLEFADNAPHVLEPIAILGLPGTVIFDLFPAVKMALPIPVQPLAQRVFAHAEDYRKPVVGVPRLLVGCRTRQHVWRRSVVEAGIPRTIS